MNRNFLLILAGLMLFQITTPFLAKASEKEALQAAESWLALVDQGKYEESWQQASTLFRRSVTMEQWKQAVTSARDLLGEVKTREFNRAEKHTSLPGVPDGQYVVIFFDSTFEKKKQGVETITPMLDKDGTWRVSGYYMK